MSFIFLKKVLLRPAIFTGVCLCFFTLFAVVFSSEAFAVGQQIGTLSSYKGGVKILRADGLTRESAKIGLALFEGDRIETDASGNGRITFVDKSAISVGNNTTLKITQYLLDSQTQKRTALVELIIGQIRLVVEPYFHWGSFQYQVKTGAATAGVRGTDFIAKVATNGASEFYVLEGSVELRSAEGLKSSVTLGANQFSQVPLGGNPSLPLSFQVPQVQGIFEALGEPIPSSLRSLEQKLPKKTPPGQDRVIKQGEWARMLSERLGLASAGLDEGMDDSAYIQLLVGGESQIIEAEDGANSSKYLAKADVSKDVASGGSYLEAKSLSGTLRVLYFVPRKGKYPIKVKSKGTILVSLGSQTVVVESNEKEENMEWRNLGQFEFDGGENVITLVVSRGSSIDAIQVDSRCADPIIPAGGWKPGQNLTYKEKAETMVQAMNQEGNLPVDNSFIRVMKAVNYQDAKGDYKVIQLNPESESQARALKAIQAGAKSAEVDYQVIFPETGVYSLSVQSSGSAPFHYVIDGCDIGKHVPAFSELNPVWEEVSSRTLPGGKHIISVNVPAGGVIESLRIVKRKNNAADHLALLNSLGFSEGALGQAVDLAAANGNLNNNFFRDQLGDDFGDPEIIAEPDVVADGPPVYLPDEDFPFGSPASPVLPSFN